MKYYYNGNLIRSSKNHIYTHAVIDVHTGRCLGCRNSKDACQSIITAEINICNQCIHNCNEIIKALEAGRSGYHSKDGRKSWYIKFNDPKHYTIDNAQEWIKNYQGRIERIQKDWQIVELECR